jgi:hypothetical protein
MPKKRNARKSLGLWTSRTKTASIRASFGSVVLWFAMVRGSWVRKLQGQPAWVGFSTEANWSGAVPHGV